MQIRENPTVILKFISEYPDVYKRNIASDASNFNDGRAKPGTNILCKSTEGFMVQWTLVSQGSFPELWHTSRERMECSGRIKPRVLGLEATE